MHDARDRNAGIWIEASDRLYVAAYSSVASLVVRFSGYFRKANGEVIEYAIDVNPTSDRAITENNVFFGAGFLLSCVAYLASGSANRGQCYARAQVQRGAGTPAIKLHTVIGGYASDISSPSFPYGKIEGSLDGAGMLRSITGTDPAAATEMTETVPTGARWRLLALRFTLVTDANVANRRVKIGLDDGTTLFMQGQSDEAQTAGTTISYSLGQWGAGISLGNNMDHFLYPLPIDLAAGYRIISSSVLLQAGDNFGAPQLLVEEWIEA